MKRRLQVLCPQSYENSVYMKVTSCTRCSVGWNRNTQRCDVETGAEHLPDEREIPSCPIEDKCQHQIQSEGPCVVRRKGLVCESALVMGGMNEDEAASVGFNAITVITEEELEDERL